MSKSIVVSVVSILIFASVGQAQKVPQPDTKLHSIFVTPDHTFQWHQDSKTSALEKAWQKADNGDQRDEVRQKVHKVLAGQFEADMKRREKELEQIEARVNRLRKQLDKRVTKMDEIIELQAKQLTMSWDGLGWSNPLGPRAAGGRFEGGGRAYAVATPSWAQAPAPPAPPMRPGAPPRLEPDAPFPTARAQSAPNQFTEKSDVLLKKILEAAEEGDGRALRTLASKLAEETDEMESVPANDTIWKIYEEVGDTVDNKKFWVTLAKAAQRATDDVEEPRTLGNILDTAARCYHLGGNIELAIELQSEAVDASAESNDGEPNEEIVEFLDKLKQLMEDDGDEDDGDEDDGDEDEEEEVEIR